jgi:hypothetical protein
MAGGRWEKGKSGNPLGRPISLPLDVQVERKKNQVNLIKLIAIYVNLTGEQALQRISSPQTLQIEEMVQGMIGKAKEGDVACFKFLIEMMVGKIPDQAPDDITSEDIEIVARVKELQEQKKLKAD